jgi:hypothetical protein
MSTPLEQHGGIVPSSDHPITLPDIHNRVVFFIYSKTSGINKDFYNSLQLNRIDIIYIVHSKNEKNADVYALHPCIEYIDLDKPVSEYLKEMCISKDIKNLFFYETHTMDPVDPKLWAVLETAKRETSIEFKDAKGQTQTLWSVGQNGTFPVCNSKSDIQSSTMYQKIHKTLSEIVIEVSDSYTPLCHLATKYCTDKSPYNLVTHRHPYTPVYDMFLRPFQLQSSLKLGEVGVLNGASIEMWKDYFPKASIHAFDISIESLVKVKAKSDANTYLVDENDVHGIVPCLEDATSDEILFDILLEDASHRLDHQLHFLKDAIRYVRPGGLLIIEDIFRAIPLTRFEEALNTISDNVHNAVIIRPEHIYRCSQGWENDRILIVWVK